MQYTWLTLCFNAVLLLRVRDSAVRVFQMGTGGEESDHCNAYDSWDWQQKRDFTRNYGDSEDASMQSSEQAPDLSQE